MTPIIFLVFALSGTPRLIGGIQAAKGQFPFMVSVEVAHPDHTHDHMCGGAILDSKNVITAAHCVINTDVSAIRVIAGEYQRSVLDTDEQFVNLTSAAVHTGFNFTESGFPNDIAILHVAMDLDLSGSFVSAIDPDTVTDRDGQICQHPGWGQLELGGPPADFLHYLDSPIISNTDCRNQWSGITGATVLSSHICNFEDNVPNPCVGDSGGPLVCDGQLSGIASWGISTCGGYPNVFTRISSHLTWINDNKVA